MIPKTFPRLFFLLIIFILALSPSYAQSFFGCTSISTPGEYLLEGNIEFFAKCMSINSSNVTLNCNFKNIKGNFAGPAILVKDSQNVQIKNCIIENSLIGILSYDSDIVVNTTLLISNTKGISSFGLSSFSTHSNSLASRINFDNNNTNITISALNNYWGSSQESQIQDTIAGNVNFIPYLSYNPFTDEDSDGIYLAQDNCPNVSNPDQYDNDFDGKGNACDLNLFFPAVAYDPLLEFPEIASSDFASQINTGFFVIQFKSMKNQGWQNELSLDIEAIKYISDFGWLIKTSETKETLESIAGVRSVIDFQPFHKITPEIYLDYTRGNLDNGDLLNLTISVYDKDIAQTKVEELGGIFVDDNPNPLPSGFNEQDVFYKVFIPSNRLLNLTLIDVILYIEKLEPFETALDIAVTTTNVRLTGWTDFGLSGNGQAVGIFDDGFDVNHPDIAARIGGATWSGGPRIGGAVGGHGTHVASTVGGDGSTSYTAPNTVAFPGFRGPAYRSILHLYQFNTPVLGSLNNLYSAPINGRVHSNSWTTSRPSCTVAPVGGLCPSGAVNFEPYSANAQLFDNFVYNNDQITAVVAAGNFGRNNQANGAASVQWNPASSPVVNTLSEVAVAKNILTVGSSDNLRLFAAPPALDDRNSNDDVSGYSARGPTGFNRQIKPDVVAPGSWISAARGNNTPNNGARLVSADYPNFPTGDNYTYKSGTSMATPHVSGMAALIREWFINTDGFATPNNNIVKAIIINGAVDMGGSNCAVAGPSHVAGNANDACARVPNVYEGWGRVNLTKSINPCDGYKCLFYATNTVASAGPNQYYVVRLSDDRAVEATLTWLEPSASSNTQNHLKINLSHIDNKTVYFVGNHFNYAGPPAPASTGETILGGDSDALLRRETVHKIIIKQTTNLENGFYNLSIIPNTVLGVVDANVKFSVVLSGVRGVDAANSSGNYTYGFTKNYAAAADPHDTVYVNAVGLPNRTDVKIYVVEYDEDRQWNTSFNMPLVDVTHRLAGNLVKRTDNKGRIFAHQVWDTKNSPVDEIQKAGGKYNIVVDVNGDDDFDPGIDLVDYSKKPGFVVYPRFCHQVDNDNDLWGGSSRGPTPDKRLKPDVVAPSVGRFVLRSNQNDDPVDKKYVWTTVTDSRYNFDRNNNKEKPAYRVSYGTSFATPTAAGVAALIREYYEVEHEVAPSGALLKATVVNGANDMADRTTSNNVDLYSQTGPIPNFREGWGRVNFTKSIKPCGVYMCVEFVNNSAVKKDKMDQYIKRFSKDQRLEITMAWMDPATSVLTSKSLYNDLSLEMISPTNKKYISTFNNFDNKGESVDTKKTGVCREVYIDKGQTGNDFVSSNIEAIASTKLPISCNSQEDIKSNVKKLILSSPGDGFWNISVIGKVVTNTGPAGQKFAIVISGIRGVDTQNSSGGYKYNFTLGETIYGASVGLPNKTKVNVYAVKHDPGFVFDSQMPLGATDKTERAAALEVVSSDTGAIDGKLIWKTAKNAKEIIRQYTTTKGKFHLLIDVDRNGKFEPGIDFVDYHDDAGFTIKCGTDDNGHSCAFLQSSDSNGVDKNFFYKDDDVYASIVALSIDKDRQSKIYVVRYDTLEHDKPLKDVTGGPENLALTKEIVADTTVHIWPTELVGGDYEIVLDLDGNGKYNESLDIRDPDGFTVLDIVEQTRFAVDSKNIVHAVGIQRGKTSKLLYASTPLEAFNVDKKHPELSDWSLDESVEWKVLRESLGTIYSNPDITTDSGGNPFIISEIHTGGFNWLLFLALNGTSGKLNYNFDGELDSSGNVIPGTGDPTDVLFYYWDDFWDPRMTFPRIEINPKTDLPVISTKVFLMYPDTFYFQNIYPSVFMRLSPLNSPILPLVPIFFAPELVSGGAVYWGDSLQVATYGIGNGNREGLIKWPANWRGHIDPITGKESTSGRSFNFVDQDVGNAMIDIATSSPRRGNWFWMPVDEYHGINDFIGNGDLAIDKDGDIHVAYFRKLNRDDLFSPSRLFYSKLDVVIDNTTKNPLFEVRGFTVPTKLSDKPVKGQHFFPAIDVDSDNKAHIVWQGQDKIHYARVGGTLTPGAMVQPLSENNFNINSFTEVDVHSMTDPIVNAKPDIVVNSLKEPIIAYRDASNSKNAIFLIKSNQSTSNSVSFGDPLEIVKPSDYASDPGINNNVLEINKYSSNLFEELFVGWTEQIGPIRSFKYKKTMPHLTFLIVIDGMDSSKFQEELDAGNLPTIEKLLKDYKSLQGKAVATYPGTTFSSYTSIMTGLQPKDHKVPGDIFKDSTGDKNFLANPNNINQYLSQNNIKTVFDYINENGGTSAAVSSIYNKGIGTSPPNKIEQANVNFNSGIISNFPSLIDYLDNINERDAQLDNNAPDFVSVYILSHDHGISTDPDAMNYAMADTDVKLIIDKLKEKNMLDNSVFIITSDHGFADVEKDATHGLKEAKNPAKTFALHQNGQIAYNYLPTTQVANQLRLDAIEIQDFSQNDATSNVYKKIDQIYIKENNAYKKLVGNAFSSAVPITLQNLLSSASGDIALIPREGYYFAEQPKDAVEASTSVPIIITGKYYEALINGTQVLTNSVSTLNLLKTIAYVVGGSSMADSINLPNNHLFAPEFSAFVGSPVNLHLFDSAGNHVGLLPDGSLENSIALAQYNFDNRSHQSEITLLQAPDDYKILIEAYDAGTFTLRVRKTTSDESFSVVFPTTEITNKSRAILDMINSNNMNLQFDFDGDNVFESTIASDYFVSIDARENNVTVFIDAQLGREFDIDLIDEIGVRIRGTALSDITNGQINILRKDSDAMYVDPLTGFAPAAVVDISTSFSNAQNDNLSLELRYNDVALGIFSEKSISLYRESGASRELVDAELDIISNRFTDFQGIGVFIASSDDVIPSIHDITATPSITRIASDTVSLAVNASDNGIIESVIAEFEGTSTQLALNPLTNLYEGTFTAPSSDGIYRFIVTVSDDRENIVSANYESIEVDTTAPQISVLSPQNGSIIKHNIVDIKFAVSETAESTYVLDLMPQQFANPSGFTLNISHGAHSLSIFSTDKAANAATQTVTFEIPADNIELSELDIPLVAKPSDEIEAVFTIKNTGNDSESVNVTFSQNNAVIASKLILLSAGESRVSKFDYTPVLGTHNLSVRALAVFGETYLADNLLFESVFVSNKSVALIVDDSVSSSTSSYQAALANAGFDFLTFDAISNNITQRRLDSFRLVVWFTGSDENTLNGNEREALSGYVNNRGYLLISGKNIGGDVGTRTAYSEIFNSKFTKNAEFGNIAGISGDSISRGLLVDINGGDEISPLDAAAIPIFNYIGGGVAAVKVEENESKVIYLAFGFEDMPLSDRNIIMGRMLDYFDVDDISPRILNASPSSVPINTTSTELALITDETAQCRISDVFGESYKFMQPFNATNGTLHLASVSGLENGVTRNLFIKCQDLRNNIASISHEILVHNRTFLAPVLSDIIDRAAKENQTINISVSAVDPENDKFIVKVEDVLSINFPKPIASRIKILNSTVNSTQNPILNLATNFDDEGQYRLRVILNDSTSIVSDEFILSIENVNRKPVISFIPPINSVEDAFFNFSVIASDADSDAITYSENTTLFNINSFIGTAGFTPRQEDIGTHMVNFTVSDGDLQESMIVPVLVSSSNDAPEVIFVSPQYATANILFSLQINATDPDGNALSYSDNTSMFNVSTSGLIRFIPSFSDVGVHIVQIITSDGMLSTSKLLNLIIQADNRAPIVRNITRQVLVIQNQTTNISVSACDPDIDPLCA